MSRLPPVPTIKAFKRSSTALRAVPMNLFPTLDSLQDVVDLAESKLPLIHKNEVTSLLMTYHNTLLKQLK